MSRLYLIELDKNFKPVFLHNGKKFRKILILEKKLKTPEYKVPPRFQWSEKRFERMGLLIQYSLIFIKFS